MKVLLDTQVVLRFLNGDKLPNRVRGIILDGESYVSVVSLWEVAIKMNIGKYDFKGGFSAFRRLVGNNGFRILPIKDKHMEALFDLPMIHRDPFDRLLLATAVSEAMPIITSDERLHKFDVQWIW
jgi:PIN domain nuclease of toxin-antitoxin system